MITVTLYTRPNCHLCDQAILELNSLQQQFPHTLKIVNIELDESLNKKYLIEIPVIVVGPYELKAPFTKQDLAVTLGAAQDSMTNKQSSISPSTKEITNGDRLSMWFVNHWLMLVNLFFIIYLGLPVLAPVLMKNNMPVPAKILYTAYSPLCHQLGFRSFFLFGEQLYYPRAAANMPGLITFGEATGINENDYLSARSFIGNQQVGYKMALCERDIAIYGAIIIFGLIFTLTGKKIPPLPLAAWLVFAIIPIGLDGFSQLFSQLPFPWLSAFLPYRESTPYLRVVTGFLFGFGTAWFGFPYLAESMRETTDLMHKKFIIVEKK